MTKKGSDKMVNLMTPGKGFLCQGVALIIYNRFLYAQA